MSSIFYTVLHIHELDDLPLARASVRQDFLQRSRQWREQLQQFGDRAGERLEGWLEEQPWDEPPAVSEVASSHPSTAAQTVDPLDDWDDDDWSDAPRVVRGRSVRNHPRDRNDWPDHEEDPWV